MSGHTPGPWDRNIKPAAKYPVIFAGRNTHVAQVITQFLPESEQEANANLIAAAPDLLAALEALVSHSAGTNTAFYADGSTKALRAAFAGQKEILQAARAAIAKAKG